MAFYLCRARGPYINKMPIPTLIECHKHPTKNMNDPRWLGSEGWVKMQKIIKTSNGKINIHFNYNTKTGKFDDFKFK